jgi:hypothetical protein
MKILRALSVFALLPALLASPLLASPLLGCSRSSTNTETGNAPAIPASSDPQGKDLVEGAIVTAEESMGGYRLYKILHVNDMPEPFGIEYHLMAYDPKADTIEESARIFRQGKVHVALDHFEVRKVHFIKRNHRVIAVEPVTDAERAPYIKSRDSRK